MPARAAAKKMKDLIAVSRQCCVEDPSILQVSSDLLLVDSDLKKVHLPLYTLGRVVLKSKVSMSLPLLIQRSSLGPLGSDA